MLSCKAACRCCSWAPESWAPERMPWLHELVGKERGAALAYPLPALCLAALVSHLEGTISQLSQCSRLKSVPDLALLRTPSHADVEPKRGLPRAAHGFKGSLPPPSAAETGSRRPGGLRQRVR